MLAIASSMIRTVALGSMGVLMALSGCAAQGGGEKKSIKDAADAFSKIVTTSTDIVREEANESPHPHSLRPPYLSRSISNCVVDDYAPDGKCRVVRQTAEEPKEAGGPAAH